MNNILKTIFVLQFLLLNLRGEVGNFKFERLTVKEGLSQSVVISIFQDSKGFIWFGTQDGLNKYDGYKFTHYKRNEKKLNSISDNYIHQVYEFNNMLWIGTNQGGLNKFDPINEKFTSYKNEPTNPNSISSNNVTAFASDDNGNLWVGTYDKGLNLFNIRTDKFNRIIIDSDKKPTVGGNHISALVYQKNKNYLWIGTFDGIRLLDISSGETFDLTDLIYNNPLEQNKIIRAIHIDRNSNVWIGTDADGLVKIENFTDANNISQVRIKNFRYSSTPGSISGNSINSICETKNGRLWLGIWGGGINRITENPESGEISFEVLKNNPLDPESLSENDVNEIIEDHSGVLWIATYGGGVNKLTPHSGNFKNYTKNYFTSNTLNDNNTTSVYEDDDNNLWIGTWNGLNKYDRKKNVFTSYTAEKIPGNVNGDFRVTSIIEDDLENLWIGTLSNGLVQYSKQYNRFKNYLFNTVGGKKLQNNYILSLLKVSDGNIWIGTRNDGILIYSPINNSISLLDVPGIEIVDPRIQNMFQDKDDNIWICTFAGLYKYNSELNKIDEILFNQSVGKILNTCGIKTIKQSDDETLWVGTYGLGLFKLIPQTDNTYDVEEYDVSCGLPSDIIYEILFHKNKDMWISTQSGIVKYQKENNTFYNFGSFEGVMFSEFKTGGYASNRNGNLYFCSIEGLLEFNPEKLLVNYSDTKVVLTSLNILNRSVQSDNAEYLRKSISYIDTLILAYNENSIALEFAALNYISSKSIKYSYMLDGFNNDFVEVDYNNRTAVYTNLDSGEYLFKVRAMLGSQKAVFTKELKIIIIPPFWKTNWFIIGSALFVVLLLFAGYSWRTYSIRRRNVELEEEVKIRTKELQEINSTKDKFFSIIAHDLKGPFSYLMNNSDMLFNNAEELTKEEINTLAFNIKSASNNLYNLLENLLQWSKYQMMGAKIETRKISINEIAEENYILYSRLAEHKKIMLNKYVENGLILHADGNILATIIRNLLANSVKYTGENGKINFNVTAEKKGILIIVSDTGVGMSSEQVSNIIQKGNIVSTLGTQKEKGTGLGLYLIKEYTNILNGSFNISSKIGDGTTVNCYIPDQSDTQAE